MDPSCLRWKISDGWMASEQQSDDEQRARLGKEEFIILLEWWGEKKGRHKETRTMREKTKDVVLTAGTGSEKW